MYQSKSCLTNKKWYSFFHTTIKAGIEAVNFDHYRSLLSDIYDQSGIYGDYSYKSGEINPVMWEYIEDLNVKFCRYIWKTDLDNSRPFSMGGISFGRRFRTNYSLKSDLLVLEEEEDPVKYELNWRIFKATVEFQSQPIKFRPWVKFPDGKIKDEFSRLGKLSKGDTTLSCLLDKVHSKFVTDHRGFLELYWLEFAKNIDNSNKPMFSFSYEQWAIDRLWPNMALPKFMV
jgi:hypothetical protein